METSGGKSNQDSGALGKVVSELVGVLGDPEVQSRLGRLAEKLDSVRSSGGPRRQVVACRQRSRRPGWVLKAVVQVMADQDAPMRTKEVHAAVEASVGEQVSRSSIKGVLADHTAGSSPRFVRIARGRYVLA